MKKPALLLATVFAAILIIFACSKDQKVVKQLDGEWKVTSQTVNGVAQPASSYEGVKYSFTKCKVKKEECDGTITDGTFTLPFKYKVSEKGEKITMTFSLLGTSTTESATITEHSKSKFVMSDEENGITTITTLEK